MTWEKTRGKEVSMFMQNFKSSFSQGIVSKLYINGKNQKSVHENIWPNRLTDKNLVQLVKLNICQ